MPAAKTPSPIDAYIAGFPPKTRKVLRSLRALIRKAAPGATETISYRIAAFRLDGRMLLYFAGFKAHVSLYPITGRLDRAFAKELEPYRSGKGTARFSLDEPLPNDLIRRIVEFQVAEVRAGPREGKGTTRPRAAGGERRLSKVKRKS